MTERLPPGFVLDPVKPPARGLRGLEKSAIDTGDAPEKGISVLRGAQPSSAESGKVNALELLSNEGKIKKEFFENLQHGSLESLDAIVLHRTAGDTAKSALSAYRTQATGAHFLIDSDGTIYQTADTGKRAYHVGKIRSRGEEEGTLSSKERAALEAELGSGNLSFGTRIRRLDAVEGKKPYPKRYPNNSNSVGIEVVGRYDDKALAFVAPTSQQIESVRLLVEALKSTYGLTNEDVYAHGVISYKDKNRTEGKGLGY